LLPFCLRLARVGPIRGKFKISRLLQYGVDRRLHPFILKTSFRRRISALHFRAANPSIILCGIHDCISGWNATFQRRWPRTCCTVRGKRTTFNVFAFRRQSAFHTSDYVDGPQNHSLQSPVVRAASIYQDSLTPERGYELNEFTFSSFPVAGVNLAQFGIRPGVTHSLPTESPQEEPFQLFEDFDLSSQIIGNETWTDLLKCRRDAFFARLSLLRIKPRASVVYHQSTSTPRDRIRYCICLN
jgi:hypothetical protein